MRVNSQAGLMPLSSPQVRALQWRAVRDIVLARDARICRACGGTCSQGEADAHHLIPRAAGGVDDPANLITLCDGCHAAHHPNLQGTLSRRTIERWGLRLARWLDHRHELADVDESLGAAMRLLGVNRLRTPQLEVILAALRGESLLLVSATGSGKSLCFQVPVLLSRGCGLVISPLKALMSQQVADLQTKKVPGTFINGDLGPQEKGIRYQLLRDGAIKFLYCTPERFDPRMVREAEVEEIARARPAYLVIDEAHCIDRWGKDFRPNYDKLGAVRRALGNPPLLAFTATAGRLSQRRILESLGIPEARVVVTGVNRPNIKFVRLDGVKDEARYPLIVNLLKVTPSGRVMLFVPTVKTGRQLQDGLRLLGLEVPFFHSKLGTANNRDTLLGRFTGRIDPPANLIICTNAFGMGLDLPDVRLVIHWQHPASVEDYLQEFGPAAPGATATPRSLSCLPERRTRGCSGSWPRRRSSRQTWTRHLSRGCSPGSSVPSRRCGRQRLPEIPAFAVPSSNTSEKSFRLNGGAWPCGSWTCSSRGLSVSGGLGSAATGAIA